ncbi:hypothetical protein PHYPSEUDO_012224 [Phytophthora pseudosyringae]|uniref:WRKY19-like zinc finger domain-containing protein n=1 Tax=Phytophthora pseudosyringae TaxID=221518 RepID=A0A8T1V7S6_9STRA|nr:hypothetical protein PHYPSEUDO_012224 [Phytophthora pseudosyringae]
MLVGGNQDPGQRRSTHSAKDLQNVTAAPNWDWSHKNASRVVTDCWMFGPLQEPQSKEWHADRPRLSQPRIGGARIVCFAEIEYARVQQRCRYIGAHFYDPRTRDSGIVLAAGALGPLTERRPILRRAARNAPEMEVELHGAKHGVVSDDRQTPGGHEPGQTAANDDEYKFGLPFILDVPVRRRGARQSALTETFAVGLLRDTGKTTANTPDLKPAAELTKAEKKRRRACKHEGCHNYIVHKGLCCRHGGGKKCSLEGCNTSAKHRGLCWKHAPLSGIPGGSVVCKQDGCDKKAKARGVCWAHGGGTKCRKVECSKVAVSNGCCWAHGGGKRCGYGGCGKPAYERTSNFCEDHYEQLRHADYFEVYAQHFWV